MNRRLRAALADPGPPSHRSGSGGRIGQVVVPGPLVLDLIAALVQGGAPPPAALQTVGAALRADGDPRGEALLLAATRVSRPEPSVRSGLAGSAGPPGRRRTSADDTGNDRLTVVVAESLGLAARSGLPPTALIRRSAAEERRRQVTAQMRAVRRLEVLLVVPAGLCLLPAFVLLGVVPVVLDLILG